MDTEASFNDAVDSIIAFLPNLLGFLLLLIVGFIIAKLLSKLVAKVLEKIGVDRRMHDADADRYLDPFLPGASISRAIAVVVFWLVFAFFVVAAISVLNVAAVTTFMNQLLAYLPNVLVAIIIFVVAALIAGTVGPAVTRAMGDTAAGRITGTVVSALVMVIAMFMILEQLQVAPEIVRIAFAAVMFALALGLALAFGLGGRDAAQRLLDDAYQKGRQEREHIREVHDARARADEMVEQTRNRRDTDTTQTRNDLDPVPPADDEPTRPL